MIYATLVGDLASLFSAVASLVIALIALRTRKVVNEVHSEVKTMNGQTMAALADRNEGRRVQADVPEASRTAAEQDYVDALTPPSDGEKKT